MGGQLEKPGAPGDVIGIRVADTRGLAASHGDGADSQAVTRLGRKHGIRARELRGHTVYPDGHYLCRRAASLLDGTGGHGSGVPETGSAAARACGMLRFIPALPICVTLHGQPGGVGLPLASPVAGVPAAHGTTGSERTAVQVSAESTSLCDRIEVGHTARRWSRTAGDRWPSALPHGRKGRSASGQGRGNGEGLQ